MSLITLTDHNAVAIVRFENPPRGYFNNEMGLELDRVVSALEADDKVRVIVFTGGVPNVFIRHYDVAEIVAVGDAVLESGRDSEALAAAARKETSLSAAFERVHRCPKPTIAAINGMCMGGGFEFALCCDIRLAGPGDYTIGLPELNIGIFPGAGGTQKLVRLLGEARALEMILRGRVVGPREAAEIGLVHSYVQDDVLQAALDIGEELSAKVPSTLARAKALIKTAYDKPLAEGMADERAQFMLTLKEEPEAMQLMRDFLATGEEIV